MMVGNFRYLLILVLCISSVFFAISCDDGGDDDAEETTSQGVFIIGGLDATRAHWRDVWKYSIDSISWVQQTTAQEFTSKYACVKNGNVIYIFGGEGESGTIVNTIWNYNLVTGSSSTLSSTSAPSPRINPSGVLYNGEMYIFGGYDSGYDDSLYAYSIANNTWRTVTVTGTDKPTGRQAHSAVVYNDKMYIFGGTNGTTIYDELWVYSFETTSWTELTGYTGYERYGHRSVIYGEYMYSIGGINSTRAYVGSILKYNFSSDTWSRETVSVPARAFAGMTIDASGNIYIVGGYDGVSYLRDFYRYKATEALLQQGTSATNVRGYMQAIYYIP